MLNTEIRHDAASVIWCDTTDVSRLVNIESLSSPTKFGSHTPPFFDFFSIASRKNDVPTRLKNRVD